MPSHAQCQELINNTISTWSTLNGVNGRKFTGPNWGTIFLPAAGHRWYDYLNYAGGYGIYWSSTLYGATRATRGTWSSTAGTQARTSTTVTAGIPCAPCAATEVHLSHNVTRINPACHAELQGGAVPPKGTLRPRRKDSVA